MRTTYFAHEPAEELISCLQAMFHLSGEEGSQRGSMHGLASLWNRNERAYFSHNLDDLWRDTGVRFTGEQGELVAASVNQARSLLRDFNSLVTKARLSFEALAGSGDAETLTTSRLHNAIAEQFVTDKRLDLRGDTLMENAGVFGSGFLMPVWDHALGRFVMAPAGQMIPSGDVAVHNLSVRDVWYDFSLDFDELDWILVGISRNRWDLIAQHPQLEAEIRSLPSVKPRYSFEEFTSQDRVRVYEFYHRSTPSLPQGRHVAFASPTAVFYNDVNPYGADPDNPEGGQRFIPVVPCQPEKILGTGLGYPLFSELLPLQELLDSGVSVIASNHSAFGLKTVLVPNQADMAVSDIGGLRFLKYNLQGNGTAGEPKELQLSGIPADHFKWVDSVKAHMMELSHINAALRGTPPPGVTSGRAIATLVTNALEFAQAASKAYALAMERVVEMALRHYRSFAAEEQVVYITGRNRQTQVRKWKGADLGNVHRVRMRSQNPLAKTVAGKMELADRYMQLGVIKTPDDLVQVMETGTLEPVSAQVLDEKQWILEENDMLRDGKPVQAVITERHAEHFLSHKTLLFDPEVRNSPEKRAAVQAHLMEHFELAQQLATMNPMLLAMIETGQIPPAPGVMPPPGGDPGAAPGGGA
ncbi:MAG TPA: hypothetical protein VEB22_12310, partial [Phycisphaerales bacterium]|nr:hypothetical protein [Phycisphaerales bacterium]